MPMKVQRTYTFIISRNFGHPITLHMEAWRAHVLLGAGVVGLLGMVFMSLMFLFQYPRVQEMRQELDNLKREQSELREQVLGKHQRQFQLKETLLARASLEANPGGEDTYIPPVEIRAVTPHMEGNTLIVTCRMVTQSTAGAAGGYLFFVFEKSDESPPFFVSSPTAPTNERGFPEHYKTGVPFALYARNQTFRGTAKLRHGQDYFTHVTIYLFSARGGMLAKQRVEIDRALFSPQGALTHDLPTPGNPGHPLAA